MELKAQAVRCFLYGLIKSLQQGNKYSQTESFPKGVHNVLRKYFGTRAIALFKGLKAGKVGSANKANGLKELSVIAIL